RWRAISMAGGAPATRPGSTSTTISRGTRCSTRSSSRICSASPCTFPRKPRRSWKLRAVFQKLLQRDEHLIQLPLDGGEPLRDRGRVLLPGGLLQGSRMFPERLGTHVGREPLQRVSGANRSHR